MMNHLEAEASAPGLSAESGPLPEVAGGPRAGGHRVRPLSSSTRLRWARSLLLVLAGAAAASAIWLPLRSAAPATPAGIDRSWSTSEVASYLGLGDASSFSSGIACQLYIEKKRPYTWVVSLCHH